MATAPDTSQLIYYQRDISGGGSEKYSGIIMASGQILKVFADTGSIVFVAFIIERNTVSGAITEDNKGCNSADVSWTDLYTCPSGSSAYVSLNTLNIGGTAGQYSVGVTVTEVEGEGPGA